ncbi:MAG: T9SS type A sorting domain-containing protein, partial [Saprospiraceae bacterium]|nr:T9SS type A sorting domain-containing protein [Saprospiraceae bacterium]MDZ4706066.1 T9SS type A sorting domain-containing protein [Saprospiraceae bacterium]
TTYNTRIDNTLPTVTPGTIAACYQTVAAAQAAAIAATTATDNCPGTVTKTAATAGTCSAIVTVTATDGCGNSATTTYNTRIDNTAPTVTTGTIAACYPTVAAAEAAALTATSATDNCPGALTETASTAGTCSAVITVTTTDGCGNSATTTYNTRIDNTLPTVTPGTIAPCYTTVAAAQAAAIAATTATDNCPGTVTKTASTVGLCSATVTVTATDFCGNSATATYTTNIDNTPPTVVCKNSTVFVNSQGVYTLLSSDVFNANASSDNCPGTLTVVSITPATVTCAQKNTTVPVTVVVADACNNQSTCISMITVDEDNSLPPGWDNSNVGVANGSAVFSPCTGENGSFVLTSLGFGTASSDKLHMAFTEICGNTVVTARVTSISGAGWGGVMIRETLMPGAKKVAMKTQLTTNIRREIRSLTNGTTTSLNYIRPGHTWLRLERSGGNFVGYSSTNGVTWSFAFAATVSMNGCVYVGIFSESINGSTVNTATFDNVTVTGTPNTLAGRPDDQFVSESGDHVQIYPNPTTGEVNINLDVHAGKPGTIQVFNTLGELITQERLIPGNLETHNMRIAGAAGVYTVVIQLDDRRIVRRVVVDPNGGR